MSFHDPPPDVTLPKSNLQGTFCLVCHVHQSHHNYTGPPRCMAVSPKGSLTFSFSSKPCGAGSNTAPKFQMVTGFKQAVLLIRVAHRSKNMVNFRFVSKLNKPWEKLSSQPHTRTPSPHQVCLSCPVNISITSRAAGGLIVTSVMLSNSWAIHTSVAPLA